MVLIQATDNVANVLAQHPATAMVFQHYQTGCVGCAIAPFDNIADVARIYHFDLAQLLDDLNAAALSLGEMG